MKKLKKKDITREKILAAARTVFSQHSYEAGSVRMIAKEGGFEFGLIRYYFPNKAELFKTVLKGACDEMLQTHKKAMKGMEKMRPEEGFSLYHDRFLKHYFNHPEGLRILINNIYRPVDSDVEIPGYEYLPQLFSSSRKLIVDTLTLNAPWDEICRFSDSWNAQLFMFVGASSCQAELLGLEPESKEYRQWVKDTITHIFLPHMKRLLVL
jgi:TetR/AcrR family transcriptional regulator